MRKTIKSVSVIIISIVFIFCLISCKSTSSSYDGVTYEVTLNKDNGEDNVILYIRDNEIFTEPEAPYKEGYEFLYWSHHKKEYTFNEYLTTSIILKAVYAKLLTVNFVDEDGSLIESKIVRENTSVDCIYPLEKDHKIFDKYINEDETIYDFESLVTADLTLKATYSPCHMVYFMDGSNEYEELRVRYGERVDKPIDPKRQGYGFDCWKDNNQEFDFNSVIDEDITLYASYFEAWDVKLINDINNNETLVKVKKGEKIDLSIIDSCYLDYEEVGETVSRPVIYKIEDYELNGTSYDFNNIVNGDLTIILKYKKIVPVVYEYATIQDLVKEYLIDDYKNIFSYINKLDLKQDYTKPNSLRIKLSKIVGDNKSSTYKIYLSKSLDFKDASVFDSGSYSYNFTNLEAKTNYFFKVVSEGFESEICMIVTDSVTPRFIDVDGVTNFRDLGGYETESGQVIKQGLLYRSAYLDYITEYGIEVATEILGIKTEIDLRRVEDDAKGIDGLGEGFMGPNVMYYNCPMDWDYNSSSNKESIQKFFEILSDESNYPIVFHCTAGADRTGFLAYLINAYLGVDILDLYDDYQITNFSIQTSRDRSFNTIRSYVDAINAKKYSTLSSRVLDYLLNDKGVNKEHLISMKEILLEEPKEKDYITISFDLNGYYINQNNKHINKIVIKENTSVNILNFVSPYKDGYIFDHFEILSNGEYIKVEEGMVFSSDSTLKAVFTSN